MSLVSLPTRDLGWLDNLGNPLGYWQVVTGGDLGQIISFYLGFFPFMIRFCLGLAFLKVLASGWGDVISFSNRSSPIYRKVRLLSVRQSRNIDH